MRLQLRLVLGRRIPHSADCFHFFYAPPSPNAHHAAGAWRSHVRSTRWALPDGKPRRGFTILIDKRRSASVALRLLGQDFTGFLVTDRWSAYGWADVHLRQLCWSHLLRDFQGWVERGGAGVVIGKKLLKRARRMFAQWHRVRGGTLTREAFGCWMQKVEREVGRLLRKAEVCPDAKVAGMAKEILKLEPALWTFVQVEGLEPTNNAAERAIRPAVLYRKGCFGTHSPEGSRFVERMLTVVATLRQQKRNVLEFLTTAYAAHLRGEPAPSLLPDTTATRSLAA